MHNNGLVYVLLKTAEKTTTTNQPTIAFETENEMRKKRECPPRRNLSRLANVSQNSHNIFINLASANSGEQSHLSHRRQMSIGRHIHFRKKQNSFRMTEKQNKRRKNSDRSSNQWVKKHSKRHILSSYSYPIVSLPKTQRRTNKTLLRDHKTVIPPSPLPSFQSLNSFAHVFAYTHHSHLIQTSDSQLFKNKYIRQWLLKNIYRDRYFVCRKRWGHKRGTYSMLSRCLIIVIHNNSLVGGGQRCGAHTIWT